VTLDVTYDFFIPFAPVDYEASAAYGYDLTAFDDSDPAEIIADLSDAFDETFSVSAFAFLDLFDTPEIATLFTLFTNLPASGPLDLGLLGFPGVGALYELTAAPGSAIGLVADGAAGSGAFILEATIIDDGTGSLSTLISSFAPSSATVAATGYLELSVSEVAPVPLPAGAALLLTGIGGLALTRRRAKATA
jgi:hypothetical protein